MDQGCDTKEQREKDKIRRDVRVEVVIYHYHQQDLIILAVLL